MMNPTLRLMQEAEVSETEENTCRICGEPVKEGQVYCLTCAADLAAAERYNEEHGNMWEGL